MVCSPVYFGPPLPSRGVAGRLTEAASRAAICLTHGQRKPSTKFEKFYEVASPISPGTVLIFTEGNEGNEGRN